MSAAGGGPRQTSHQDRGSVVMPSRSVLPRHTVATSFEAGGAGKGAHDRVDRREVRMRLLRGLTKVALITKVIDEARKPQNQAKIKQLASKLSRGSRSRPDATR
jgi:hypothetical protein